tara:strand:- start:455 stop:619 length:165 start_codon:yes stop_codon:yes gene_type:complete
MSTHSEYTYINLVINLGFGLFPKDVKKRCDVLLVLKDQPVFRTDFEDFWLAFLK